MIDYKIDVLTALKEKGYNTGRIRRENLLSQGVLQRLRNKQVLTLDNISKICSLLECQPGDILEFKEEGKENNEYKE